MTCPGNRHARGYYGDCIKCDAQDATSRATPPAMERVDGAFRCPELAYTAPVLLTHRFASPAAIRAKSTDSAGSAVTFRCWGCDRSKSTAGSKTYSMGRKHCAACVAAKESK